jgi:hypothetical protein
METVMKAQATESGLGNATSTEVFAESVVDDVVKGRTRKTYRGTLA